MKHFYLFTLLAIIFNACTPARVVRVEPPSAEAIDRYVYGNPVQRQSTEDVSVEVNYFDATPFYLIFDLEVSNHGKSTFDFDPTTALLTSDVSGPEPAINPEVQLLTLDLDAVRNRRRREAGLLAGEVVTLASSIYLISDQGGDFLDNAPALFETTLYAVSGAVGATTSAFAAGNAPPSYVSAGNVRQQDTELDPAEREFWFYQSLRRTTIRPGERVFGKLVFRLDAEATRYTLSVLANGERFGFDFVQKVFKP